MGKFLTTKQWVTKAQLKHNGQYGYQMVDYIDSKTPVQINCLIHGLFFQIPANHLQGQGCPECGIEKAANSNKNNTELFIEKAILKHGPKYDYSQVDYQKSNIKVKIICPVHGMFEQLPNNHLSGAGCRKCK